ncbi:unnamed protein product [Adineta ricciae]|nr:unnamed protein product [Adineta ricciae]
MKYLYPFECEKLQLSSPGELQAAIEGNRREGRRPSYAFEYSSPPQIMAPPPPPVTTASTNAFLASPLAHRTLDSNHAAMAAALSHPFFFAAAAASSSSRDINESPSSASTTPRIIPSFDDHHHFSAGIKRSMSPCFLSKSNDDNNNANKKFAPTTNSPSLLSQASKLKILSKGHSPDQQSNEKSVNFSIELNGITYQGVLTDHPSLALTESYDEEIVPLLTTIDQIRNRVADVDTTIELPSIVVIGEQSSGKSSVLEALSGIPLPRGGQHMTTKCPLELRMRRSTTWHASLECPGRQKRDNIASVQEISQYINDAQNYLTNGRDQISKQVLVLNVQAPWLPNLTLIDLPGIIQVTSTQQDSTSVNMIEELVGDYLVKRTTIILAIIQACNDIETSAAIKYAKMYDRDGERTVGVLTKLDLVDRGTEQKLLEVFQNKRIRLKLGYLMVKCRSQEDIDNDIELSDALRKEEQFFSRSAKFHSIPKERRGCPSLARFLTHELVRNIKQALPRLISDLRTKINNTEQKFRHLGIEDYTQLLLTNEARSRHLTEKLFTSMQLFRTEIHGVEEGAQVNNPLYSKRNELNQKFYYDMYKCKLQNHDLIQYIKSAMIATQGPEPSDYILFRVTKTVCLNYLKSIRFPMREYFSNMLERTRAVIANVIDKVFHARPNLLMQMRSMHDEIEKQLKAECQRELELILEMEESFVYADHPLYKDTLKQMKRIHRHDYSEPSTVTTVSQAARLPVVMTTNSATNSITTSVKRTNSVMKDDDDDELEDEFSPPEKISRTSNRGGNSFWNNIWPTSRSDSSEPLPNNHNISRITSDHVTTTTTTGAAAMAATVPSRSAVINGTQDNTNDEEITEYKIRILAMQDIICQRIVLTFPQRIEYQLVRKQFSQLDLQSSILSSTSLEKLDHLMAQDPEIERQQNDLINKRKLYDETIKDLQNLDRYQSTSDSTENR